MAFERLGEFKFSQEEARKSLPLALEMVKQQPSNDNAWNHLGHLWDVLNEPYKALKCLKHAYELKPEDGANALNYACLLNQFNRYPEADPLFAYAHEKDPQRRYASNCYAEVLIRNGDYLKGWSLFDSIRESSRNINMEGCVEWDGLADIRGKGVAVISEGGAGDVYMMWRYVPLLAKMGAKLSIVTFEQQIELLHHQKWAKETEGATYPFDYWVSTFSFPAKFGNTIDNIPTGRYMNSDPERVAYYKDWLSRYPRPWVGLCWEAGEVSDPRKYRSLSKKQARRLISLTGCTWVNMQYKTEPLGRHVVEPEHRGWYDSAALLDALDLFITVDTGICNLAGAMATNTWTLLGGWFDCKFSHRETCPWYPSMRIFKNKGLGFNRSVEFCRDALKDYCERFSEAPLCGEAVGLGSLDSQQREVLSEAANA